MAASDWSAYHGGVFDGCDYNGNMVTMRMIWMIMFMMMLIMMIIIISPTKMTMTMVN